MRTIAYLMLLGSLLPLGVALVSQYAFGMPPCHFCLLQRYPYVVVALCGIALLLLNGKHQQLLTLIAIMAWMTTAGLGLYHTGIEQGWVEYAGGCVAQTSGETNEAIMQDILSAPAVSCADATTFLGLSMASWNAITALIWPLLLLRLLRRSRVNA